MELEADIRDWDGKSTGSIKAAYQAHCLSRNFVSDLVSLVRKPHCQTGATWLLKHHWEQTGRTLPPDLAERLLREAGDMRAWPARLHVLQMVGALEMTGHGAELAFGFASGCLADENAFVRAWGYHAIAVVAAAHPQFHDRALAHLRQGKGRETRASVKVRLRKALALLGAGGATR